MEGATKVKTSEFANVHDREYASSSGSGLSMDFGFPWWSLGRPSWLKPFCLREEIHAQ